MNHELKVKWTARFKKEYKLCAKRGLDITKLDNVIRLIANREILPEMFKDHALTGNWAGYRECHINTDWLLVYMIGEDILVLTLTRTGTHSDLFKL